MKEVITIANYEAYYLDYLEGNLSDELVAAFELFLAAHPELAIDGDLEILLPESIQMDAFEKEILKKDPDLNTAIGQEVGLIADFEGVLSPADQLILETHKTANPTLKHDSRILAYTTLKPDLSLVTSKENLYRKEIALFTYPRIYRAAGIAAIFVVGFFLFKMNSGSSSPKGQYAIARTIPNDSLNQQGVGPDFQTNSLHNTHFAANPSTTGVEHKNPKEINNKPVNPKMEQNQDERPIHHPTILPEIKDNKVIAIAPIVEEKGKTNATNQDMAMASNKTEAVTPIQYLKTKVEDKLDGQIALTTNDRSKGEKKGFFLKLGSVEISHNRASK